MKITIPMTPTGTNHAYHTNQGRWYKDEKITVWEDTCLWILKKYTRLIQAPITTMTIGFYFNNNRKNDIDGRVKFVLDLLQKARFYNDDSEIVDLYLKKRFDKEKPRIEIEFSLNFTP